MCMHDILFAPLSLAGVYLQCTVFADTSSVEHEEAHNIEKKR